MPSAKEVELGPGARVAVGLMDYSGRNSDPDERARTKSAYLKTMVVFCERLSQRGCELVLIGGDQLDAEPIRWVASELETRGHRPVVPPMPQSLDEVLDVLRDVDIVVGTRYHNLISGLMLGRPTLSVSYAPKSTALLESFGLGEYAQDIEDLDPDLLERQFDYMLHRAPELLPRLQGALSTAQSAADQQLDEVMAMIARDKSTVRP